MRKVNELVKRVRGAYSGLLTTAPNGHGHELWVSWWDALDIIGVDLYDQIAGETVDEMVESWQPYLKILERMHRQIRNRKDMEQTVANWT